MTGEPYRESVFPQVLHRVLVGVQVTQVHGLEHLADLPARCVKAWGGGSGDLPRFAVGVLAQDAADPEGAGLGLSQALSGLGGDVCDDLSDSSSHFFRWKLIPAGQRAEREGFRGVELPRADLFAAFPGPVLGRAVVPDSGDDAVSQEGLCGVGPGPGLGLGNESLFAALGQKWTSPVFVDT